MPASSGNEQLGARPTRPVDADELADWQARTFRPLARFAPLPPGELSLDDEVADEPLDDPDATRAHIAALRAAGRIA